MRAQPETAPDPQTPIAAQRHLLQLAGMSATRLRTFLQAAREHAERPMRDFADALRGRVVAILFFEDSTRTRVSFSIAAKRLGAAVADLAEAGSSASKGETLVDTAMTVEAMGAEALIVRCKQPGGAELIARHVRTSVLNAGDGRHEHPTQGLLDVYALAEAHDRLDGFDLTGLRVAIVGDISNSRVARSDIASMTALGAEVICVGPPALAPRSLESLGCVIERDFDAIVPDLDAVQMLRIQAERGAVAGSVREYRTRYELDEARAARMKPGAVVMHPGPMNRGVEIAASVADGPRSLVRRQVAAGLLVRMAALRLLLESEAS